MCLQVPLRVQKVGGRNVIVEGGRCLIKEPSQDIAPGNFVISYGNMVVAVLSSREGKEIRVALGLGRELSSKDNE